MIPPATPEDLALDLEAVLARAEAATEGEDDFYYAVRRDVPALVRLAAHWKREAERRSEALADELGRFGPDP